MIRVLSWGCGTQSTVLGEMAVQGMLDPLDAIITSDTGWERQATYDARDFYTERWRKMGQRVEIVSNGNIRQAGAEEHIHVPFWTETGGPLLRQCTREFKLTPVKRKAREVAGYHATLPPHPPADTAEVWLGISLDEHARAKPSRIKFMANRWPLLEMKMTRGDCIKWLEERGLPVPPKSACICCPYRQAAEWLEMKRDAPAEFQAAVEFDNVNRGNPLTARGGSSASSLYLWSGCEPLETADFEAWAERARKVYGYQIPMFICDSGHCWA